MYSAVQFDTVQFSTVQYSTLLSTVEYNAVQYNVHVSARNTSDTIDVRNSSLPAKTGRGQTKPMLGDKKTHSFSADRQRSHLNWFSLALTANEAFIERKICHEFLLK